MNIAAFDTHEIVKELKAAGFSEQQAEAVTHVVQKARYIDTSILATKSDLASLKKEILLDVKADLAELKAEILKWMFGAMVAQTGLIVALLKVL